VAREASDMVLRDDAFASIVAAVAQGRVVFGNIRSFVRYLISCNLSEIIVVVLGVLLQTALPILPLQILFLNLVTDVFPALALGLGEGDDSVMERPPRDPKEPILTRRHWIENVVFGTVIAVCVLGALLISQHLLGFDETKAVTVSFVTLALAQLWHVFNMREPGSSLVANQVTRNRYIWMALALCLGLILAAVYVPPLAAALDTVNPGVSGWLVALVMSLLPTVFGQLWLSVRPRRGGSLAT
jgi:Ca2+-transporting ATPase